MKFLLKSASYIFHPIWMPFAGAFLYFLVTPRFFPKEVIEAKLLAISIMTIFIPVVFFFMLKTLGKVRSHFLTEVKERKWPLLFYALLNIIIMKYVLDMFDYPELYYFFLGIFISTLLGLMLVISRLKISLHMMGLAGTTIFLILLSLHFSLNLIYTISFFIAIIGLTASSRLYYNAHSTSELLWGLLLGMFPQLAVAILWL
ncbi:hypothetical protein [Salinimicrobium soli]|uniref:hypothetical protein n=1 Tax=Salinimicrobium soli TaxID=1254399 RepID=UPI003AAF619A